jgi:phosphatidylethanolamine-binding protein (PEBP) family uncharacterized protein
MAVAVFADGSDIPAKYTQACSQTPPANTWTNVLAGTMSFFLYMHDTEVIGKAVYIGRFHRPQ